MRLANADDIVEEGADLLGSFPAAYQHLTQVLADPTANADRIAVAIRVDPALTARLLGFANAAHRSKGKEIQSISHAVAMCGRSQLRDLATSSAIVSMFRGIPEHLIDMGAFWRHSMAVGIAAERLSNAVDRSRPSLFVPGLLHDIGALLLYMTRPDLARSILIATENLATEVREAESMWLGADHTEMGAQLLERWGLPVLSVACARFHHSPSEAAAPLQWAADLVHLADVAVSAMQLGNGGERGAHPLDETAWDRVGLKPIEAFLALAEIQDEVQEIATILDA
ncbi:MAG: HDOD domain-containing protein [Myxococcota bacterium]